MVVDSVILEIGKLGLWVQAVGLFIVLWIVFQVILLFYNAHRTKKLYHIIIDMKRIEGKIDKLLKKK